MQADITSQLAVQQEVVNVDITDQLALAVYFHVTQRTDFVRAAGHVEGVVDSGKGRQGKCAGHLYFTHHADGDGARLAYCQVNL